MFNLAGKHAVVTGGASGIGKAISVLFAHQGAIVHIIDHNQETAGLAAREIEDQGQKAFAHAADVSNQQEIVQVFNRIGQVDILVNNAGVAHIGKATATQEEDFDRIYRINVKGVYNCLYAALPYLQQKGGAIVNMASIAAIVGLADRFAYSMSKGAVYAMTISVARDYVQDKIRCNSISPARIHTPFVDGFLEKNYPGREQEVFQQLSAGQPVGRMGTPAEVAALALYLCSDEAGFVTGCDYPLDGGFIKINT